MSRWYEGMRLGILHLGMTTISSTLTFACGEPVPFTMYAPWKQPNGKKCEECQKIEIMLELAE